MFESTTANITPTINSAMPIDQHTTPHTMSMATNRRKPTAAMIVRSDNPRRVPHHSAIATAAMAAAMESTKRTSISGPSFP